MHQQLVLKILHPEFFVDQIHIDHALIPTYIVPTARSVVMAWSVGVVVSAKPLVVQDLIVFLIKNAYRVIADSHSGAIEELIRCFRRCYASGDVIINNAALLQI